MKKLIPMALVLITATTLATGCSSVYNQDKSATASSPASNSSFQERKNKILKHIEKREVKIDRIEKCVQAANNSEELQACKPKEHRYHERRHH